MFKIPRGKAKKSTWPAWLLLSIFFFSLSPVLEGTGYSNSISAKCLPSFPDKDGWYGGDGAYSIKLDQERTLWLFGDTFVSNEPDRKDRMDMNVVLGTTLAISTCSDEDQFAIKYFIKKKNGEFTSWFGENEWLWPQDPFLVNQILYVPLLVIEAVPELKEPFQFKVAGHKLAKINNFKAADPNQWTVTFINLTPGIPQNIMALATTSVVFKDHVYYYPFYTSTTGDSVISGNMLARIPINNLDEPAKAIEYFTKEGLWEKGLDPGKAKMVLSAGVSELSVRYHDEEKKWIAVYLSTGNNGKQLLYQEADRLEGPWTDPEALIESIPEVDPQNPRFDKNAFCYAGKEHIEFAQGRNLVVTYVCNSYEDIQKATSFIRNHLFLYRPVVNVIRR